MMWRGLLVLITLAGLVGPLASSHAAEAAPVSRPHIFSFPADTLAYANELLWEYELNPATGQMVGHRRLPKPGYALHCFAVAREARQFFDHARFEPKEPKASPAIYRHLVRQVLARSTRTPSRDSDRIVIPGYANLRQFSLEQEALLKRAGGGAWHSYVQRGNWRMVFPFSRRHQEDTAEQLWRELQGGHPPVVHLVRFPSLALNHVLLLIDARQTPEEIRFVAYDPNQPAAPVPLVFKRASRRFWFPPSTYFAGGRVDVYEIYRGCLY